MRTRLTSRRGLSLVEVTIMLFVLMLLTGVLAPSIMDFVRDAQWVKVKEDCEAIGVSVARLTRDVGPCLKFNGTGPCTKSNRVDVLYSDGPDVTPADMSGDATPTSTAARPRPRNSTGTKTTRAATRWSTSSSTTAAGRITRRRQISATTRRRGRRSASAGAAPTCRRPIGPDPWGHRYLVNTVFLADGDRRQLLEPEDGRRAHADGLVERHVLHFAGAQRPVRNRLRRQRHARRLPAAATTSSTSSPAARGRPRPAER